MNLLTARLRSLLSALLLLSLPACAEPDKSTTDTIPFEGRVLEAGTQKPIPGAIVLARWTEVRSAWVDTQDVCVHVETTTSDEDGRFRLPRYRGRNPTLFDSYKAGYEAYRFNTTEAYSRQESWLQRSTAGRGERLRYLKHMEEATRCNAESERKKVRLPLLRALFGEADSTATTKDERRVVYSLHFVVDSMEVGEEKAFSNLEARQKADNE